MFVPMSREKFEILAKHLKGEVVKIRGGESDFLVVQGITFSISKEDATYKIHAFQPEVDRNASTFHSEAEWKKLTTSIKVSSEKPLETIAKVWYFTAFTCVFGIGKYLTYTQILKSEDNLSTYGAECEC